MSQEESSRLDPMGLRDLGLIRPDERAATHDVLATDHEPVDAMRAREHECRDEILSTAELEAVRAPHGEIGAFAWCERADVVATQHSRTATGAESQRLSRGHRSRPAASPRDQERLLDLHEQIAALVRRRAVDAEADPHTRGYEIGNRRDTCSEPEIRRRAMGDARSGRGELSHLYRGQVDAVGAPDVGCKPAKAFEVLDGRAAVELLAVGAFLGGLGEVGVERQPEATSERCGLLHQPRRHRERRARGDSDLDASLRARFVQRAGEPLGLGEDCVDLLDQLVWWQPAVRHAEIHRAAGRDEPQAELAGRLHLGLDQPVAATREDVVVVEDGRAAGERELG
jgi:hypothetical protein